ncbi:MAG: S41 family peptidase [Pseudomonadota bacterium]
MSIQIVCGFAALLALGAGDSGQLDNEASTLGSVEETTIYPAIARSIAETMRAHHYNPTELETSAYRAIEQAIADLAETVDSDDALLSGFSEIWQDGPFSHVTLNKARGTADELAAYLDGMEVGGGGAVLSWQDDAAVLTVNTMMGTDTIEEISAAYQAIAARGADKLIIDLRANEGGAFAVRPLVGHLMQQPYTAGGFVSQPWNSANDKPPTLEDMQSVAPWSGWSVRRFWADAQAQPLTVVQFEPIEPVFDGLVYVLTSERTASAAELAADALKGSGRATIIGEQTAGQMLSQKIYDVEGGFHLSLPIADYFSAVHGRIEGTGVEPDIEARAEDAMDISLRHH